MQSLSSVRSRRPLILHLVGAALFALIVLWQVFSVFFTPVDLFIHHSYLVDEFRRFSVFGLVFYGFSLLVLRLCTLPNTWGILYAIGSWLLFIFAYYPTLPLGSSGMMRRVANAAEYETARQSFMQTFQALRMVSTFGFGALQAALLWSAYRQLCAGEALPEKAA